MWKPLSIVSGVILLSTGAIMYTQVQYPLRSERKQAVAAKENLEAANKTQKISREKRIQSDADKVQADKELADNASKAKIALGQKEQKVAEVTAETAKRDAAAKELADLDKRLKDLGGLPRLVAELKELEAKKTTLVSSIENTKGVIAATIAHKEATDKVIEQLKMRELFQKTGTMKEGFTTYVSAVNPELGFVIFAHGDNSNVTRGAKFDITRDGRLIAKATVTHLEAGKSTAEIVPGTLSAGETVQPGDRAVVNVSSTPRSMAAGAAAKAAPKKDAKKPADSSKPAAPADPFASPDGAAPVEKPAEQ